MIHQNRFEMVSQVTGFGIYDKQKDVTVISHLSHIDASNFARILLFYCDKSYEEGMKHVDIPEEIVITLYQKPSSLRKKCWSNKEFIDHINMDDYLPTFTNTVENVEKIPTNKLQDLLSIIFEDFNINQPEYFASYSLMPQDIVQINERRWLCCSDGWEEIIMEDC